MNEKKEDWEDLRLFIAVAEEGGLSGAARVTKTSPATLGRRMLTLERRLNRELFVRYDRGYRLTDDGRTFLSEVKEIDARITHMSRTTTMDTKPLVKISAGTWTTLALIKRYDAIVRGVPLARLRFVSAEAILDIPRREVGIGFRNKRPTEPNLAGRKLSHVSFAPYATTDTAKGWIKVLSDTPSGRWLQSNVGPDVTCEVTTPRNALDLALAGYGKVLLPTFIGATETTLKQVGELVDDLAHEQWIVTHQDDRHLPEVRQTIDRLCAILSAEK